MNPVGHELFYTPENERQKRLEKVPKIVGFLKGGVQGEGVAGEP